MSLVKREDLESDVYTGERHVQMKAELRVMLLHTMEHHRLPANHQKLERGRGESLPHRPQKPAHTLISDFSSLEPWDNTFSCSLPLRLWYVTTVGLGKYWNSWLHHTCELRGGPIQISYTQHSFGCCPRNMVRTGHRKYFPEPTWQLHQKVKGQASFKPDPLLLASKLQKHS